MNGARVEKIYLVYTRPLTWREHEALGNKYGYRLASITSPEENRKVQEAIQKKYNGRHVNVWIGGIRKQRDGSTKINTKNMGRGRGSDTSTWRWSDGSPWRYTNWNRGEPNDCCGQSEHYLQMYGSSGKWNDLFDYRLPAVYTKSINRYQEHSVEVTNTDTIININNLTNNNMM